jgi:hypothetical protein
MEACPICQTKIDKNYDYCRNCAWEFEYYFDELSDKEMGRYKYRFNLYSSIYQKFIIQPKMDFKEENNITIFNGLMYQNQPFLKRFNWKEANEYSKKIKLGGFNDWRLPNIDELKNILTHHKNKGKHGKYYIRKEFVDNLENNGWFWSNIKSKEYPSYAWNINFKNGNDTLEHVENKFFVLCVR